MEGPYFKPNSPRRTSLVTPSTPGVPLTVSGYVFGRSCRPISGALLDFWQADTNGSSDMATNSRGHQYTAADGSFSLTTIVPGLYPGRTRHIHVKAQAPGGRILTTQLYFPNEPRNNTDALFDPELLMNVRNVGNGRQGSFNFVLDVAQTPGPSEPPTRPPTEPRNHWASGTSYRAGDRVTYGGVAYRCLQAHQAISGWEPPNVPALWERG
ncbi:dioxygenase [Streptomyces californicus]